MNITIKKCTALFLSIIIIMSAISLGTSQIYALPLDTPLLYYNDSTWAREDRCPLKIIDNEFYVPVVIFAQLDNAKVRVNNNLNTFVISNGNKYLSFDASTDIATDHENTYFYIRTYKLDYGERYVPVKIVCERLGYNFEYFENKYRSETAIRISDSTAELSLEELLEKHNPGLLELTNDQSEHNTDTGSHVSSEANPDNAVLPAGPYGNRIIYITFDTGINEYTETILNTLSYYGYKATFFTDDTNITEYPQTLARAIAEGHKIGIKPTADNIDAYTDIESFIEALNETNDLLYRVFKIKTRTIRPDPIAYNNAKLISAINSDTISEYGYAVWNENVPRADALMSNTEAISQITDAIRDKNTVVISFGSNATTATVLSGVLRFIYNNAEKCDVRLADSAYNPII